MKTVYASQAGPVEDQQLVELVEEITARLQAGQSCDVEDYAARFPEYADRLRQWVSVMSAMADLGHSLAGATAGPAAAVVHGSPDPTHPTFAIGSPPPCGEGLGEGVGVLGDFRILRELGRGGMGVVYEAEQLSIGRRVALKVLPFAAMLDKQQLNRFKNEARAAGTLDHPNIVAIHSVGTERGVHYYAMHLVEGQSLAQVIAALRAKSVVSSPLSVAKNLSPPCGEGLGEGVPATDHGQRTTDTQPVAALTTLPDFDSREYYRTVARLGIQAAEALDHAHQNGILHRDIKPANLLVESNFITPSPLRGGPGRGSEDTSHLKLWITDFGLARIEQDAGMTMTGDILGTLRYMSPEQALANRVVVDHRSDIYSLGVTLYELLTLRPAYTGDDRHELLRQIAFEEPRKPRQINGHIPQDLETIILKAIEKNPADRYATSKEFAEDLRRFLENKSIEARRPSLVEQGRKWIARHVALVAVVAVAATVVGAIGAAAAFLTVRAYHSEAQQRAAAEANLTVASQIIDRMLSRTADDRYFRGELAEAETLAADATEFYEKLLAHSDDPDLRFRAAEAHGSVAHVWVLVGRHEKAGIAARRAGELLLRLTTQYPGRSKYLAALASNYNRIGLVDWSLDRPVAAEPSFRQAWEIWTELAQRYPNDPSYQSGVADMLANLGSICYFSDRFAEAEEYYRRAEAIKEHLPDELKNSAAGLASQAGSCTNQAELARLRGQYDRALELLEQSIPLHQQSLAKWPTNPVALDCYFHTHWNIVECNLGADRPAEAAAAIERLVEAFPDRLASYHAGAEQLLRCAAFLETKNAGAGEAPAELQSASQAGSARASLSQVYRQRAHELVAKASEAPVRTPDTTNRFAWFLLTCEDQSFRDVPQALELAKTAVQGVPERGDAWMALALAQYRNSNWQAADDAVQKSSKLSRDDKSLAYNRLLHSMTRAQQGREDESRQLGKQARDWIAENKSDDENLLALAAEADELRATTHPDLSKPTTDEN